MESKTTALEILFWIKSLIRSSVENFLETESGLTWQLHIVLQGPRK